MGKFERFVKLAGANSVGCLAKHFGTCVKINRFSIMVIIYLKSMLI